MANKSPLPIALQTGIFRGKLGWEGGEIRFFYEPGHSHWHSWGAWHDWHRWHFGTICSRRRHLGLEGGVWWGKWLNADHFTGTPSMGFWNQHFLASIFVWPWLFPVDRLGHFWHFPAGKQHVGAKFLLGVKDTHCCAEVTLLCRAQWCRAGHSESTVRFLWWLIHDRDLPRFPGVGAYWFITVNSQSCWLYPFQ